MVLTVACLGLRSCELLALQWGDLDFLNFTVKIQRSVVQGEINPPKTEDSEGVLPLDPALAELLKVHRQRSLYLQPTDFVFPGNSGKPAKDQKRFLVFEFPVSNFEFRNFVFLLSTF